MTDCKMFALVPAIAATVLNGKTIRAARAVIRRELFVHQRRKAGMARPAAMSGRRRSERQACKWRTHCGEIANAAPFSALRGRPAMPVAEAFKAAQSQGGQGRLRPLQLIKKVCETAGKTISGDRLKDFFRPATAGRPVFHRQNCRIRGGNAGVLRGRNPIPGKISAPGR